MNQSQNAPSLIERITTVFRNLSITQKITVVGSMVVTVAALWMLVQWAGAPDMVPLFSNLPAEDAGKITQWLDENQVPFELEQGGSRILVPRKHQYQSRIQLAQEGLPTVRGTGYEIFDETNLGMSEFVQKLNFRRALEGELSRTVTSLDEVDDARVHIVLPEEALFREQQEDPSASVTLKLRGGLKEGQIAGITHLIASSVEGLSSDQVTVIDSQGNILSDMRASDPLMAMTSTQLQLKNDVERNLTSKVETMLTQLLGPDKSIVRVSVELDFTHSQTTSETYDPDQTAVRSEEINENSRNTQDQETINPVDPTQPPLASTDTETESNIITNYEVSKTLTQESRQTGGVKRISASILIDGVYQTIETEEGDETSQYMERSTEEMTKIEQAVRGALGADNTRGDQISVLNIPFQQPEIIEPPLDPVGWFADNWSTLLRNVLIAAAVLGILLYVRNLLTTSSHAARELWERKMAALPGGPSLSSGVLPGAEGEGGETLALPDIDSEMPQEVIEANQLQQRLVDFVGEKPEVTARLLKTWLVEGD